MATIRDAPPKQILDVGAGSGYFSKALLEQADGLSALCVDCGYADDRDESIAGKPVAFRKTICASDADLVLMMDVIEHVEDDVALVAEYVGKVRSGTNFIVTVPAFMWLWSGHDVFLEHYRRYTLAQLTGVLRAAGLVVDAGQYFYASVLPLVVGVRAGKRLAGGMRHPESDMRTYSAAVNSLLYAVCRLEVAIMRYNRLAGTSVLVRAHKP
ncbi:class I SAM-dependent methyltransferase [Polymorphobacter fuscus]|nr:methyltransferase domain-containing protein [Polymorphobacter fuscus]NJC08579.1 trans-aconitate methyltransferase [Polymorphobacter fuscus]